MPHRSRSGRLVEIRLGRTPQRLAVCLATGVQEEADEEDDGERRKCVWVFFSLFLYKMGLSDAISIVSDSFHQ